MTQASMRQARKIVALIFILAIAAAAEAGKRDPLTDAEADQLREVAQEPYKRLKLLIKFTGARLDSITQLRADPKAAEGRGRKIHDLLEDFTALVDELNDNLDQYQGRPLSKDDRKDFHKGLKELIQAYDQFDLKLKNLSVAAENDAQSRSEAADFRFVIQDAQEALKSSISLTNEYLSDADKEPEKKDKDQEKKKH
ncbi:MAG TPA: hypothetical protein VKZ53_01600 [Candidatus Angelobacter sp.]|nr:hypothetical protein [Candidatus Angelobacter sp.]